jgi:hypothetical protein
MEGQIFLGIPADSLLNAFRDIVREELSNINASSSQDEKLISPKETVELFNPKISKQTLKAWTDGGKIPCYNIGRRTFYKRSEVIAALPSLKKFSKTP